MASEGLHGLAERYALALFEAARDKDALEKTEQDIVTIESLIHSHDEFRMLLDNPVIGRQVQEKAVTAIARQLHLSGTVQSFLGVVARNGRLPALSAIVKAFIALLSRYRGEATALVKTALPLTDSQKKSLVDALTRATGRTIKIQAMVDPALLGGMVVQLGSQLIDVSLHSQLQRLEKVMKGAA